MQRIYAARDLPALKVGFAVQTIGPWLTSFAGVFIGTMGVWMLADAGHDPNPPSPFTAIIEEVISLGGFAEVIGKSTSCFTIHVEFRIGAKANPVLILSIGVIALTASLAAIMSTADSLIIAISQLITVEVVWPLYPNASQRQLAWSGRFTSLFSVCVGLITGILWKSGVGALTAINFPLIIQSVPAYIIGLYANTESQRLHPWSLAFGAICGTTYVFAFFFGYLYQNKESKPINAGITGVLLNIILSYLIEMLWFDRAKLSYYLKFAKKVKSSEDSDDIQLPSPLPRPTWDIPSGKRFGDGQLTASLLNKMMEGFPEPLRNPAYCGLFFFVVSMITPLVAEGQPVINADTGEFVTDPPIVRGLPWWFVKQVIIAIIPYLYLFKAIWDMPNEYPFDERQIDREGVDPELLELTTKEMNFRAHFDAPNESILRRRSSVSAKMEAMGISCSSKVTKEDPIDNIPEESRLSCIIRIEELEASGGGPFLDEHDDVNSCEHVGEAVVL